MGGCGNDAGISVYGPFRAQLNGGRPFVKALCPTVMDRAAHRMQPARHRSGIDSDRIRHSAGGHRAGRSPRIRSGGVMRRPVFPAPAIPLFGFPAATALTQPSAESHPPQVRRFDFPPDDGDVNRCIRQAIGSGKEAVAARARIYQMLYGAGVRVPWKTRPSPDTAGAVSIRVNGRGCTGASGPDRCGTRIHSETFRPDRGEIFRGVCCRTAQNGSDPVPSATLPATPCAGTIVFRRTENTSGVMFGAWNSPGRMTRGRRCVDAGKPVTAVYRFAADDDPSHSAWPQDYPAPPVEVAEQIQRGLRIVTIHTYIGRCDEWCRDGEPGRTARMSRAGC